MQATGTPAFSCRNLVELPLAYAVLSRTNMQAHKPQQSSQHKRASNTHLHRHRHRNTQRHTHTETHTHRHRHTQTHTHRHTDTQTHTQTHKHTHSPATTICPCCAACSMALDAESGPLRRIHGGNHPSLQPSAPATHRADHFNHSRGLPPWWVVNAAKSF